MCQGEGWRDEWKGNVSKNGLAHVHKFFYGGDGADKAMQKVRREGLSSWAISSLDNERFSEYPNST